MITGSVSAGIMTGNPLLGLVVGWISHYLLDSIMHAEYRIGFMDPARAADSSKAQDLLKMLIDGSLGLILVFLAFWFWSLPLGVVLAGALGGIMPDLIQVAQRFLPNRVFAGLNRIHSFAHCAQIDKCPEVEVSVYRALFYQAVLVTVILILTHLMIG